MDNELDKLRIEVCNFAMVWHGYMANDGSAPAELVKRFYAKIRELKQADFKMRELHDINCSPKKKTSPEEPMVSFELREKLDKEGRP